MNSSIKTNQYLFGLTRIQLIILGAMTGMLCLIISCLIGLVIFLPTQYSKPEKIDQYINVTPETNTFFIQTITEFETSNFCKIYKCAFSGSSEYLGTTYDMYIVNAYPNEYDDILIELNTKNEVIIEFGLTLDGMPPSRPHLTSDDLQFIYAFLASISKNQEIDTKLKEFVNNNIESDITQICFADSIGFGILHIWAGKVREPTVVIAENCPK